MKITQTKRENNERRKYQEKKKILSYKSYKTDREEKLKECKDKEEKTRAGKEREKEVKI